MIEKNLLKLIEEEKVRITNELMPKKKWWHFIKSTTYYTTWQIANTKPYIQDKIEELIVRYKKLTFATDLIVLLIIIIIISVSIYFRQWLGLGVIGVFVTLIVIHSIKQWKKSKDGIPQLIINHNGIYSELLKKSIPWKYLIETFIKEQYSEDSTSYFLLISYYDLDLKTFSKLEIPLYDFDIPHEMIAYAIEYIKMSHKSI